ncbi:MAG: YigZ family protein, partial [Acidobacteria bacterium]|nr:YigZ family protein [Acidobacteriota bacterium]
EYYDATHHCYAIRIGLGGDLIEKFSDAGEPSHTAGEPILNALRQNQISNSICIVVRYFGGTKLGKGGLIRAYHQSALSAVNSAKLKEVFEVEKCCFETGFQAEGALRNLLIKGNGKIIEEERTSNGLILTVDIPKHRRVEFEAKVKELKEKWKNEFTWKWK